MEESDHLYIDDDGVVLHVVPFMRSAYNYDTNAASLLSGLECLDETRTQQQFKEECDINTIVERFGLTGQLPTGLKVPTVGEFDTLLDYQGALNKLREADEAFMQMPAAIRAQFDNDPGRFVDFVSNEDNLEQCKAWGLGAPETPLPTPIDVRVIATPSDTEKNA